MPNHKGGKKNRKLGRNARKCEVYRLARSVPNKLRKLKRHTAQHPNDTVAGWALKRAKHSTAMPIAA